MSLQVDRLALSCHLISDSRSNFWVASCLELIVDNSDQIWCTPVLLLDQGLQESNLLFLLKSGLLSRYNISPLLPSLHINFILSCCGQLTFELFDFGDSRFNILVPLLSLAASLFRISWYLWGRIRVFYLSSFPWWFKSGNCRWLLSHSRRSTFTKRTCQSILYLVT